jgi:protein decreased size exclusion limit 1
MPRHRRPDPVSTLRGHKDDVTAVAFLNQRPPFEKDVRLLLSGDAAGCLRLWNSHIEETILTFPSACSGLSPVIAIEQDPVTDALFVQQKTGSVRRIVLSHNPFKVDAQFFQSSEIEACQLPDSFCPIKLLRTGVIVGPGGPIHDEGSGSGMVLRDERAGSGMPVTVRCIEADSSHGMLMSIAPHSVAGRHEETSIISAGYEDGSVLTWDIRTVQRSLYRAKVSSESILSMDSSPRGGGIVIVGSASNEIVAVIGNDVVARKALRSGGIASLRWRDDGKVVASAGWDGRIRFWDGRRNHRFLRSMGSLHWHDEGGVQALAFSKDMNYLASGGRDRTLALWNCFADSDENSFK